MPNLAGKAITIKDTQVYNSINNKGRSQEVGILELNKAPKSLSKISPMNYNNDLNKQHKLHLNYA